MRAYSLLLFSQLYLVPFEPSRLLHSVNISVQLVSSVVTKDGLAKMVCRFWQPANIAVIFVTLEVLKEERSKEVRLRHSANIPSIFSTFWVVKFVPKVMVFKLGQLENIRNMFLTLEVLKEERFNSVRLRHSANIAFIFSTCSVVKFVPKVMVFRLGQPENI